MRVKIRRKHVGAGMKRVKKEKACGSNNEVQEGENIR